MKLLHLHIFLFLNSLAIGQGIISAEKRFDLGLEKRSQNQYTEAISEFTKSVALAYKEGNYELYARAIQNKAWCLFFINQYDEAQALLLDNLGKVKEHLGKDHIEVANFYYCLGALETRKSNVEASIDYFEEAIDIAIQLGDEEKQLSKYYNALGISYSEKSDLQKALDAYELSLSLKEKLFGKNALEVAKTLNNIGVVYQAVPEPLRALEYYERSLDIKRMVLGQSNPRVADTYNNMATVYRDINELDISVFYLNKALEIEERVFGKESFAVMTKLGVLASVESRRGNHKVALAYMDRCIQITNQVFDHQHYLKGRNYRSKAEIYSRMQHFDNALLYYQKAIEVLVPEFRAKDIYALPSLEDIRINVDLIEALKGKGSSLLSIYKETGRIDNLEYAIRTFKVCSEASDIILNTYQDENSKLYLQSDAKRIYEDAIEAAYLLYQEDKKEEYIDLAFAYSQKSKLSVLRRLLSDRSDMVSSNIPVKLLEKEEAIQSQLILVQEQINDSKIRYITDSSRQKLLIEKINLTREKELLIEAIKDKHPEYYLQKYDLETFTVSRVRASLKSKNHLLIDYFTSPEAIYKLVISKEGVIFTRRVIDQEDDLKVNRFIRMLKDQESADRKGNSSAYFELFCDRSNDVYSLLFEDIHLTDKNQLTIVPDDWIHQIPIDILLYNKGDYETVDYSKLPYLFRRHSINYQYSIQAFLTTEGSVKKIRKAVFYAPKYNSKGENVLSPLTFAQAEADQIRTEIGIGDMMNGGTGLKIRFEQFSQDKELLHLAMHASINNEDPLQSALYFGSNKSEVLRAYELYNLDLDNADLVVLSACNTAAGKLSKGEGILGLSRGFQVSGVSSLLLSLWKADDENTKEIMVLFYQFLKEGYSKDVALQKAKLSFLEAKPLKQHPYYWAPFIQVGDPSPFRFDSKNSKLPFIILFAVLCGILVLKIGALRRLTSK